MLPGFLSSGSTWCSAGTSLHPAAGQCVLGAAWGQGVKELEQGWGLGEACKAVPSSM